MTEKEWRQFISAGTRTGKLATVRADGRPHVVPIWFLLDEDELIFTTWHSSVKTGNMRRQPRVALAVDDESFPYAFVMLEGEARIEAPDPEALLPYTTAIARRYVGVERAAAFGRRNAVEGELLVRVHITHVASGMDMAD